LQVIRRAEEFSAVLDAERAQGRSIGLVPTLGALHAGHRSLVERAWEETTCVVVTIFVNPLQFNEPSDLAAYPRTLSQDLRLLEGDAANGGGAGADIVFVPDVIEMYPDHPTPPATIVHVVGISDGLEGTFRPGHFDGVTTVVAKLFALAGRCRAYFGEKDFQQLAVVRRMARDLRFPVDVVGCATVREPDGLALSSRNVRLGPEHRKSAAVIHRALEAAAAAISAGEDRPAVVTAIMTELIATEKDVEVEYAVAVDPSDLTTPVRLGELDRGEARLLIAARVGDVRLIDNIGVSFKAGIGA
jgi:pantoate--beta-alanine ligase